MRCLLDNNVPRSVTHFLADRGWDAIEVRQVLAPNAPDAEVLAYGRATDRILLTHDRGLARRARVARHPLLWLRTVETDDRDRLAAELTAIETAFASGAVELHLLVSRLRIV